MISIIENEPCECIAFQPTGCKMLQSTSWIENKGYVSSNFVFLVPAFCIS